MDSFHCSKHGNRPCAFRSRAILHAPADGSTYLDNIYSSQTLGSAAAIDQAMTLRNAFSVLNSNEKRVLELAYFEGLSQSEIAARLQEPLGTVKSWTRSALGRLRSAIKGGVAK